ncbi:PepSY-associated TM helix domain-containing protein [Catalinimonas alkaloidigena]|uniref:PepSY-associated TM helix domain-containing protein n=1 Tax=Catalinimonas alkaloidigena TaxID=1075417 RepID=UPI000B7F700A|nr:PepSY-associated TM helix domain-containing protein [Catalinimonas alkaloidigena]
MTLKRLIGSLHLWLGLASGLIVFIVALTGCLYAFQEEIQNLTQPYRFVEEAQGTPLPPSQLQRIAEEALPEKKVHAVLYPKAGEAAQVIFYNYEPEYYYYLVYLNPYTGAIQQVKDMEADFFQIVLDGHFYLWLPAPIGQPVVATATLVFVVMLLTGLVLWWPKNKSAARQRFSIKWNARWRRKNYDLHNVLGVYALWLALVLALTGLVWGFQWFAQGTYTALGGEKELMYIEPLSDTTATLVQEAEAVPAMDRIWQQMRREHPTAEVLEVHVPETPASPIAANVNTQDGTFWRLDYRYFDQYTLEELSVDHVYGRLADADATDKLFRMNYDIHTGAILGFPGKLLAFFASLIVASLPVTGFLIWWGRRKKSRQRNPLPKRSAPAPARKNRAAVARVDPS